MKTSPIAADAFAASAGLDAISGVFGYLTSLNAAAVANSRADMVRREAEANAQRYQEQADAQNAQRKVMFLASGVTLAGSPIDVLATQARISAENISAIRMRGASEAFSEEQGGEEALVKGRNAIASGAAQGASIYNRGSYLSLLAGKTGFGFSDPSMTDGPSASAFATTGRTT